MLENKQNRNQISSNQADSNIKGSQIQNSDIHNTEKQREEKLSNLKMKGKSKQSHSILSYSQSSFCAYSSLYQFIHSPSIFSNTKPIGRTIFKKASGFFEYKSVYTKNSVKEISKK